MDASTAIAGFVIGYSLAQAADPKNGEGRVYWWIGAMIAGLIVVGLSIARAMGKY